MGRWDDQLYQSYIKTCKQIEINPIDSVEFMSTLRKQQKVLSYMIDLGRPAPWLVSPVDDTFSLYAQVKNDKVIINILTKNELKAFGIEEKLRPNK